MLSVDDPESAAIEDGITAQRRQIIFQITAIAEMGFSVFSFSGPQVMPRSACILAICAAVGFRRSSSGSDSVSRFARLVVASRMMLR